MGKTTGLPKIGIVTILAFFTWGFTMLSRTAFGYYLTELSLSAVRAGWANFLTSICLFFSAIVFTRLVERTGKYRGILSAQLLLTAVAVAAMGYARSYAVVLLVKGLLGVGCGPIFALMMTMVERNSTPESYPGNAAIVANGEAILNTMLGPILVVGCLGFFGFRKTNLLLAALVGTMALLWRLAAPRDSAPSGKHPQKEATSFRELLSCPDVLVCACGSIFSLIPCWCIYVYVPSLLQSTGRYSDTVMSFAMTAMGAFMMIWMLITPKLCKALGTKLAGALLGASAVTGLTLLSLFPGNLGCVGLFVIFGGNCSVVSMIFMAIIPVERIEPSKSASAMALVNGSAELLGASVGPLIAGMIADSAGMGAGMLFAAGCMLCALLAGLFQSHKTT